MTAAVVFRDSDTYSHRTGVAQVRENLRRFHLLQNLLGGANGAFKSGGGQDNPEFVAAASEYQVRISNRLLQNLCDLRQDLVADDVAKGVIDELETVDVDHQQR